MPKIPPTASSRSHFALNDDLRKIGKDSSVKSRRTFKRKWRARKLVKLKADHFKKLRKSGPITKNKRFGNYYRKRLDLQDELFSTSTVREFINGILDSDNKNPLTASQETELNEVLNNVSTVRIPTRFSGFATSTEVMQHPTGGGRGVFFPKVKNHYEPDRARREAVLEDMEAEYRNGGDLESIIYAGLKRSISYTLNDFTAPVTASDVNPHLQGKTLTKTDENQQLLARERVKSYFVELGGKQEAGPVSRGRSWTKRRGRGRRSVSPPRLPKAKITFTDALA